MYTEEQLIKGCKAGKRKAQKYLYNRYYPLMLGVCMRYCKSKEDAEDVMLKAFMTVFTKLKNFKGDGSLLTNITVDQNATVIEEFTNQTSVAVTHNFGSKNVLATVYNSSDEQIIPGTVTTTNTNVLIVFCFCLELNINIKNF